MTAPLVHFGEGAALQFSLVRDFYFMQKSCEFLALEIFYTPPRSHFSTVTLLLLKPYIGQFS